MRNNKLFEKQNFLQKQARIVLKNLKLTKILSKYGEVKIVGSMILGLMTWPDIDIDLKSKTKINKKDYFKIVKYLFSQKNIKQIMLIDNRNSFEKNRPESMYIGIKYNLNNTEWKIDIRYLNIPDAYAENHIKQIKSKLTKNKINIILKIKNAFHSHAKYRKEFSAYNIYNAVLKENISTINNFIDYLKKSNIKS